MKHHAMRQGSVSAIKVDGVIGRITIVAFTSADGETVSEVGHSHIWALRSSSTFLDVIFWWAICASNSLTKGFSSCEWPSTSNT